jgi:16S rRNA processing protein RimM
VTDPGAGPGRVAVGRITNAHGVSGEVSVLVLSEVEHRFDPGVSFLLEDGRSLTIDEVRPHRGRLLVRFAGVPDRNAAELLAQQYLFVDASAVPDAPEGAFWPHQLQGCEVVTDDGRPLGTIVEIVLGVANDIWVARDGEREVLIPALKDVVVEVDVSGRRVVVHPIPGLLDPDDASG